MKSKRRFVVSMTTVLLVWGLTGCGSVDRGRDEHRDEHADHGGGDSDAGPADEHADPREIDVLELTPEAISRTDIRTTAASNRPLGSHRTTTGEVGFDENRLAHVTPRLGGRLVRVPVELGAKVRAGEVLAVLDSTELGRARADYLRTRARHEVAAKHFARERSLRDDRISSERDVLDAEAAAREAAADFAAARETLRLYGLADEEIAALSWDDPQGSLLEVRAPFGGRVVERDATLGELVEPRSHLFTIADLSEVWLWVDLYERDLAHVAEGQLVEVTLDAWPGESFGGTLTYIAHRIDTASRTVRARLDLPNPGGRLKPGMFARVALASGPHEEGAHTHQGDGDDPAEHHHAEDPPVLTVPLAAVQRGPAGSVVFVRTAPTRFERRQVELGRQASGWVEILSGLAVGDDVVTDGAFLLRSEAAADEISGHHH